MFYRPDLSVPTVFVVLGFREGETGDRWDTTVWDHVRALRHGRGRTYTLLVP
jgi:hypothetical protein